VKESSSVVLSIGYLSAKYRGKLADGTGWGQLSEGLRKNASPKQWFSNLKGQSLIDCDLPDLAIYVPFKNRITDHDSQNYGYLHPWSCRSTTVHSGSTVLYCALGSYSQTTVTACRSSFTSRSPCRVMDLWQLYPQSLVRSLILCDFRSNP